MIHEINVEKASQRAKDLYNKGSLALERGNFDFAIEVLYSAVEMEPGLVPARKLLRIAEIRKFRQKKSGWLSSMTSSASSLPGYLKTQALFKSNKAEEALVASEALMKVEPLNVRYVKMFVESAVSVGMPNAALQTLELVREFHPNDIYILSCMGTLYQKIGRTKSAKECIEKLCEISPNDPEVNKLLKDITAIDSMKVWDDASDYRDVIKDKKEAELLEKESKAVTNLNDVDVLIADVMQRIQQEPENMKLYRSAARLYIQKQDFAQAVALLEKAISLNPGDPELDVALNSARVGQYDFHISEMEKQGRQNEAVDLRNQRVQYIFDNLSDRVRRYPNDLKLRYEWGLMLYEHDYVNESIQQLQLAQRSPKHRIRSLYYLALCFKQKKQYDLAHEQLEKAKEESPIMDGTKKDIFYELGCVDELMGQNDRALGYFKEIYQVDIGYKDIAQKVEKAYGGQQQPAGADGPMQPDPQ
ncbi:MAG: hypothetical protein C0404_07295 [Verrucomicrobia bacterium]|nr:hypothetical protein [Verrucomicrobiota bacterium]